MQGLCQNAWGDIRNLLSLHEKIKNDQSMEWGKDYYCIFLFSYCTLVLLSVQSWHVEEAVQVTHRVIIHGNVITTFEGNKNHLTSSHMDFINKWGFIVMNVTNGLLALKLKSNQFPTQEIQ